MSRGGRLRRGPEPTRTTNLDGIFTLNECADYIAEDKWPTIPDAVSDLAVTKGNGTLDLSWSAPSSNGLPFSLYIIEYTPSGGSATTVTTSNTSYQITGLTNDTEYSVRVGAVIGDRVNYSAAVTGTPVAVTVIDLTPLAVSVTNGDRIELQNLDSAYPEIYGSAPQNGNYNFGAFGWQIAELTFYGGISPSGPFPIQLPSHSFNYVTLSDIGGPGRSLRFYRNSGKIEISVDSNPCIIGGNVRIDITNIVFEKVTDGVVTHRLGPYASGPFYSAYCSD